MISAISYTANAERGWPVRNLVDAATVPGDHQAMARGVAATLRRTHETL
jgi:hypothetical protein